MRHDEAKKKEARELYIRSNVRNLVHLEDLTGITRTTLRKWREDERWDETVAALDVDPLALLSMYIRLETRLLKEIEEKELAGEIPADSTLKRQLLYRKMAKSIDAQYDVNGSVLRFADKFIDYVSGVPDFEGKKEFVAHLNKMLPRFLEFVIHAR